MKDPKKYLKTSDREMFDPDVFMRYQRSSTAGASGTSVTPSSKKSFFSQSLRTFKNFFTPSTGQKAHTQNVSLNEEEEQQNSIDVQQNIVPVQNIQAQQIAPQPIKNVEQPAKTEGRLDSQEALHQSPEERAVPVQAPEQEVKPDEAVQEPPAQVTQSEQEDETLTEEKVEYG